MSMHNPAYPDEVIKELCVDPLDFSVTDATKALGIRRKTLSNILNSHAGAS